MSNEDMSLPRTHIEEMDFAEMKHRQELEAQRVKEDGETKRAKYRLREARQETYQFIGIGFLVAAVIITVILAFWNPWAPPSPPEPDTETQREITCVQNGGGFVPDDLIVQGDSGLCVYPGKTVPVPDE